MKKIFLLSAVSLALAACSSDDTVAPDSGNSFGQLVVSGKAETGVTLTTSISDADGIADGAISYQWQADGVDIAGATSDSLLLTESVLNAEITVTVTYVDNGDNSETIKSSPTSAVEIPAVEVPGMIVITGTLESGKVLTATLTDANGLEGVTPTYTWMANGTAIADSNSETYALTDNEIGTTISVKASYEDNDEFSAEVTSATTLVVSSAGLNSPATFAGDLSMSTMNDQTTDVTGTITVMDDDAGESSIKAQTDTLTTYGQFSIDAQGQWTYTLDTTNSTISSLADDSDTVTDTISVSSEDDTTTDVVITISGPSSNMMLSKVAKLSDHMDDDAGELRYKLGSDVEQGKITVSFYKDDKAETADGVAKDAYIGLYGNSTSTSNAIVDLRIQSDKFVIRDQDDIDVTIPFTPAKWTDVEMTWDASSASTTVAPLVTITINGTSVTTDAFTSASSSLSDVENGLRNVIFKLGDNGSEIPDASYYVDDVKIYSDLAGTTVVFEDDFESYSVGDSLDEDNTSSPYNSNSAEVFVAELLKPGSDGGDNGSGEPVDNQMAKITDTMSDDAGELRYKLGSSVLAGKLTVSFLKDDKAETADGTAKDAYIGLFGSSTSTSNAIVDLRIQSDKFVIRDQDDIDVTVPFTPGVWTEVEMTWDASSASTTVAPLVTIKINGTSVTTEAFSSASSSLSDVVSGLQNVIFKLGDNGSEIPNAAYYIDNVKIYSDLAGTTVEFEDDFESYSEGVSLDEDNDDSPYNSNSAEVVVVKEG